MPVLISQFVQEGTQNRPLCYIAVFYVNKEKASKYLQPTGNPISSAVQIPDGFIHSVTDAGSNVNRTGNTQNCPLCYKLTKYIEK